MKSSNSFYGLALVMLALICGLLYDNSATAASAAPNTDNIVASSPEVSQTASEQTVVSFATGGTGISNNIDNTVSAKPATDLVYFSDTEAIDKAAFNAEFEAYLRNFSTNKFYSLATVDRQTFLMPISQNIGVPCGCHMQGARYRYVRITQDSPPECVDDCGPIIDRQSLPSTTSLLKRKPPAERTFGASWRG